MASGKLGIASAPYNGEFNQQFINAAKELSINLKEGIYAAVPGLILKPVRNIVI